MSHPTFFDYGMRGESDQVVPINPFRHSPAYLRPLPLSLALSFCHPSSGMSVLMLFSLSLFQVVTSLLMVLLRILVAFTLESWLKSSQKVGGEKTAQKLEQGETAGLLDHVDGFGFC